MWGDGYPHLEGTFGQTRETLHTLFDDADEGHRSLVTIDNFERLFEPALISV
jgi:hypothetical protein